MFDSGSSSYSGFSKTTYESSRFQAEAARMKATTLPAEVMEGLIKEFKQADSELKDKLNQLRQDYYDKLAGKTENTWKNCNKLMKINQRNTLNQAMQNQ